MNFANLPTSTLQGMFNSIQPTLQGGPPLSKEQAVAIQESELEITAILDARKSQEAESAPEATAVEQVQNYKPEMGETKPEANCELRQCFISGYHYIVTKVSLELNRSIKLLKTYRSEDLTPYAQDKVGWHKYRVTEHGLKMLLKNKDLTFSREVLLT